MAKKLVQVMKNNGVISFSDSRYIYTVPAHLHNIVNEGDTWLVDMDGDDVSDLLVKTQREGIIVHEIESIVHYSLGNAEVVDEHSLETEHSVLDSIEKIDNLQDVNQTLEIIKSDYEIGKKDHVLNTGNAVSISSKVVGRNLIRECKDLSVTSILPVDREILKCLVEDNAPLPYDPIEGIITLPNGDRVPINEHDLSHIFPDIRVQATHTSEQDVSGTITSKYMKGAPQINVGTHLGQYTVDPHASKFITPVMNYSLSNSLINKVSFDFKPISYDSFKESLQNYAEGQDTRYEELEDVLLQEYTNFDGKPIVLTVYDRMQLLESLEISVEDLNPEVPRTR